ncbi:MAG: cyclic pyranopterin phosphate synthase [Alteromonadaceae bacterium]|jgi:cyclic pyranopterin phosphate synthase
MLEDNFGRRFRYLRLSITDVCNFRCVYCLPNGYTCEEPRDFLRVDEVRRLVRTFAELGTTKIRLTGGEPSLRKELPEMIQICKETPGVQSVALTTNGYKLTSQIKDWVDAGLDALNISMDSLDPRMFQSLTGHDKFEEIMTGIDMAFALGLKTIKINAVLMRQYNAHEFQSFLDWVKDKPITLRFIELMKTGDNPQFFEDNHVSGASLKEKILEQGWQRIIRSKDAGPAQEFEHPDHQGRIGLIMPYSKDFCSTCNRLRISARGKLHLCLFSEYGLDLREFLQDDDHEALANQIRYLLQDKKATHDLHEGLTGGTKHLAMIGG